ncbi:hypothetical protein [Anabaena azotica]|uniref:hypothetical protein n=1 Tax=Anabaena azotica TaxID=197653 RepID=UPI0039A5A09B
MSLRDGVLLTLFNTVVCLVLPKLLSMISAAKKTQINQEEQQINIPISEPNPEIPSFS